MPIFEGNPGGVLPRSFEGVETTIRGHGRRITVLERLHTEIVMQGSGGHRGVALWSGIGPPTLLNGINGDFYIDYEHWGLYGPKNAITGWGNFVDLDALPERRQLVVSAVDMVPLESVFATTMIWRSERITRVSVQDLSGTPKMARVRAYVRAADRDEDIERSSFDEPFRDHGLLLEIIDTEIRMSPAAYLLAQRDTIDGDWEVAASIPQPVYWNIESYNPDDSFVSVTIDITKAEVTRSDD